MKPELDNPTLTAYALGETDALTRRQVESRLATDPAARQYVDEVRAAAAALSDALRSESLASAAAAPAPSVATTLRPRFWSRPRTWAAVAAVLAISTAGVVAVKSMHSPTRYARLDERTSYSLQQLGGAILLYNQDAVPPVAGGTPQLAHDGQNVLSGDGHAEYSPPPKAGAGELTLSGANTVVGNNTITGSTVISNGQTTVSTGGLVLAGQTPLPRGVNGAGGGFGTTPGAIKNDIASPSATLAVRGTDFSLLDQPPYSAPAVSLTGRAAFRDFRNLPSDPNNIQQREPVQSQPADAGLNTNDYGHLIDNPFLAVANNPLSTFSIDVDTASYSIVRRYLHDGQLPPVDAVRIEEMINYFPYHYAAPDGDAPFSANVEVAGCPWQADHRLVRVALKGKEIAPDHRPLTNLVFLIDVSGSMMPENKLPMLKQAMKMLVNKLGENDRVAIAVYAGNAGLVLPSTVCTDAGKQSVLNALDHLEAGGSTNGGQGIELAYQIAGSAFLKDGVNRVILCTDGDFNVGMTDQGSLVRMIQEKAKTGIFLSVLGVGYDNLKDGTIVNLADSGNGNYAYLDSLNEAKKVLIDQMSGTLVTIAKDVKIQVEFNPAKVSNYRLIGYEKRALRAEDFNDDKKDAGEIGAGHTVTALYEITPAGAGSNPAADHPAVDPLKYQPAAAPVIPPPPATLPASDELLTVKLRYKDPTGETSRLQEFPVIDRGRSYAQASEDFKFAASVAEFGMVLRQSPYKGSANLSAVQELADEAKGDNPTGYRQEFVNLLERAKELGVR